MKRSDDYQERRAHLANLSDEQLEQRFWSLCGSLVDPLLKLGYENTTPAVERSVVLRMGFSSLEAKAIVDGCWERGLLGHGAGHVILAVAKKLGLDVRQAGLRLAEGQNWDVAEGLFGSTPIVSATSNSAAAGGK